MKSNVFNQWSNAGLSGYTCKQFTIKNRKIQLKNPKDLTQNK